MIAQYYQFLRLGRTGFTRVQQTCRDVATTLSAKIAELGPFRLLTDGSQLPVFAFTVADGQPFSAFDLSAALRERGWLVPAYTFPAKREDLAALRIVVRNGFSHDMAQLFLRDVRTAIDWLDGLQSPLPQEEQPSTFHH